MAPLIALVAGTLIARLFGHFRGGPTAEWNASARVGVASLFVVTGVAHFVGSLRDDMVRMVPPIFGNGELWVAFTGVAEFCGAVGILVPRTTRAAALGLLLLLLAIFPANVYVALNAIPFGGKPPTALSFRTLEQLFFLAAVGFAGFGRPRVDAAQRSPESPERAA